MKNINQYDSHVPLQSQIYIDVAVMLLAIHGFFIHTAGRFRIEGRGP